tara:strand:- start:388 stop:597 length:210 start_codon:yes stop_codon:yes gene_type:complete
VEVVSTISGITDSTSSLEETVASEREVSIKTTAAAVVSLERKSPAPELPNIVWLAPDPKAEPMAAPFPV